MTTLDVLAVPASTAGKVGTHGPVWLFFVFAVVFMIFGIAMIINPKLQWQMSRWQFKNPQATEPSAQGLVAIRVFAIFFTLIAIALLIFGITKI